MRRAHDSIWVIGDSLDDGVEDRVDDSIGEGLGLVLAVEESSISLGGLDGARIGHVMLEGIVDVEVDGGHGGRLSSPLAGAWLGASNGSCRESSLLTWKMLGEYLPESLSAAS